MLGIWNLRNGMCGIAGFTGEHNPALLKRMTDTIRYRGPDDEGFFSDGEINLGMRRLSIIDLTGGRQPLFSEDRNIATVVNGEIYNFKEVRSELEKRGHAFASRTDVEVIAHGYEEFGTGIFPRIKGMFAVALWDAEKHALILARDRMGEKPLFYAKAGDNLIFGSEIKALLAHPAIRKEINPEALSLYMTYEYVPAPLTMYKNIFKLKAGHVLTFQNGSLAAVPYWEFPPAPQGTIRFDDAAHTLDTLLENAVRTQLVADVPLGVFLSGGIDSSTIAYYARKHFSGPLQTFSIGFSDRSFDESAYARAVAQHLGTEHHEAIFSEHELLDLIPSLQTRLDEPFADPSLFPTYLLASFAKTKVTVALAGDGGDELLLGYPTFQARRLFGWYFHLPRPIRHYLMHPLIQRLPTSFANITFEYGLKRLDLSAAYPSLMRDLIWIGAFTPQEKRNLFAEGFFPPRMPDNTFAPLERIFAAHSPHPLFNQISMGYLGTYLTDDILVKTDRASMYTSLEARNPFLDPAVVEYILSLPPSYKMRGVTTKYILKKIMENRLPYAVLHRKKKGFGIPVAHWLLTELRPLVQELLLDSHAIQRQGIFNSAFIQKVWREHEARTRNNRKPLWTLIMFQLWYKNWFRA